MSAQLAQALKFIVSIVMTKQGKGILSTQNKLYCVEAVSSDEATGKVIPLAQADFPEFQFHTACYWELEAAPQQEPAITVTIDDLDLVQDWAESRLPPGTYKLYAAPQQAQAPGWQPIETAPENTEREVVVQWMDSDGAICRDLDYREDGCWMGWHNHADHVEIIGGHGVSYTPPYTEWMPIPAPQQGSKT